MDSLRQIRLEDLQLPCALEQLPHVRSAGFPKACVLCPLCATRSHAGAGAAEVFPASSNNDEFLFRIRRQSAQGVVAPVPQN